MNHLHFITLLLIVWPLLINSQTKASLTSLNITISNVRSSEGKINACLISEKDDFLKDCKVYANIYARDASSSFISFSDIVPGSYAVSVYHDENDNGSLDTGLFGIPKEPYGFSNNPRSKKPKYQDCLFQVKSNGSNQTISLR